MTDEESTKMVKNKLKFKIPDWFIERRIKTPAELRESPDRLVLYDNNTPDEQAQPESGAAQPAGNGDQSHTNGQKVHRGPREKLEELVDMGNGILTSGASKTCWDTESTIILTLMDSESAYPDYLESFVHDMAKRMGVTVITIDTSELEFLGWDLYLQEKEWHYRRETGLIGKNSPGMPMPERSWGYAMASLYFGGREVDEKRQKLAMTAIFDAGRAKAIETNSWISPKRIMVYLRNCHEILEAMIGHNEHGLGCLRTFTNYVRELREKSQMAFLVCAMPGDWADTLPLKIIDNLPRLDWKQPLEVHVDPPEAIAVNPAFVAAETRRTNMFRLQCRLRWRCPERVEAQLLDFFFDWPGLTDDEREAIESRHWEEDELDRAKVQICGRSQYHKPVGFADVLMILRRTGLLDWYVPEEEIEPEPEPEQEEEPKQKRKRKERSGCNLEPDRPPKKSKKTGKYKEDRRWRKKMAKLAKSCDDYKVKLIDNVVNPDELNTSWDDVILLEGPSEPVRLMLTRAHFTQALRAIRPSNSGVSSKLLEFARRFNPELSGDAFE
ncbi:AAA family ATPase [Colletotrichum plurivorum]|uniref:AAA family ATPase n=1 Tax=Colletotrichum plurivorum TaxID=2175906 RepID=A0A8H6K4I5_9PEZI|nr:AAA family ATPase [Colletotrichum plurivorum]